MGRTSNDRLAKLSEYVANHEDDAYFAVFRQPGDHYDVALVVEGRILELGKAQAVAQGHAKENRLPYR